MEVEQARLLQPAIRRFHRSVHDLRPLMTRRTRQPVLRLWAFQPILPRVQLRHIPLTFPQLHISRCSSPGGSGCPRRSPARCPRRCCRPRHQSRPWPCWLSDGRLRRTIVRASAIPAAPAISEDVKPTITTMHPPCFQSNKQTRNSAAIMRTRRIQANAKLLELNTGLNPLGDTSS